MNTIKLITILALFTIIWGCSDQGPTESATTAEQEILAEIAAIENSADEDYFYSNLDDETEENFFKSGDTFLDKPIVPLRFGRIGLRPIIKNIQIFFTSDTTADAYFYKVLRGNFVSLVADTSDEDTVSIYRTVRPMGHEFQRTVHFVKKDGRWRMKEFSLALGNSLGVTDTERVSTTLEIVKMIVSTDGESIEITDPLNFFQTRQNVFAFNMGSEVGVVVHVKNSTTYPVYFPKDTEQTEIVRLHHTRHRWRRLHGIKKMAYMGKDEDGNNVYQGSWFIGQWPGIHHAAIDVIDNGTIFDDDTNTYPYNSTTWSTPYRVNFP